MSEAMESQVEFSGFSSEKININVLLEAGAHFGHPRSKWNPKMKEYIFAGRGNVYIINLQKTLELLKEAYNFAKEVAQRGGRFLFVGTKKQAQDLIKQEAITCNQFYVNKKWIPGTLTNFPSIRRSVQKLVKIEKMEADGSINQLPKGEINKLMKLKKKLLDKLEGIRDMKTLPDALYVVDITKEEIAVMEARKLGIPIIAIVDTNADPTLVDYPIPANDDAVRSIQVITEVIKSAILEGESLAIKKEYTSAEEKEEIEEPEKIEISEDIESLEDKEG
jgi:small subunit ribosomal protein S2